MLNKVFVMGRLGRDPELRRTQSGTPVTTFSLAVDRDFKSQNGEREVDWLDVVAWRNTAEFVSKFFTKGRVAIVEGRLQTRSWRDREGNNRTTVEIIADNVYFGDSKREGGQTDGYAPAPAYGAPRGGYAPAGRPVTVYPGAGEFAEIDEEDGDLPF